MPRDGISAKAIHTDWTAKGIRPVADTFHTATVRITRPDEFSAGAFDDVTGSQIAPDPYVVVTSLPARINVARQVSDLNVRQTGEERLNIRRYLVMLPWNWTDITVKDVITVTASEDPGLVGRELQVMDVQQESLHAERVLRCEVYQR